MSSILHLALVMRLDLVSSEIRWWLTRGLSFNNYYFDFTVIFGTCIWKGGCLSEVFILGDLTVFPKIFETPRLFLLILQCKLFFFEGGL